MEGIREFEKNILTEMDFIDRYLNIELKFIKNNSDKILKCDKKTFMAMVDTQYQLKHEGGAYYTITKKYNKYEFVLEIHKTTSAFLLFYVYIYIYIYGSNITECRLESCCSSIRLLTIQ